MISRVINNDNEGQHNFWSVDRILWSDREIQRASHPEREAVEEEGVDDSQMSRTARNHSCPTLERGPSARSVQTT